MLRAHPVKAGCARFFCGRLTPPGAEDEPFTVNFG